jgi:osmotically-inducible protein OsmY
MKTAKTLKRIMAATAVAASLAACSAISGRETAGQYVDDATISTNVRAGLLSDTGFKATQIHVETMQGVVQLSGFVDKPSDRAKAEHIAWNVKGVKDVHDDIVVRPPSNG